jgi:membrane fusion protein (multidrug efflux system)
MMKVIPWIIVSVLLTGTVLGLYSYKTSLQKTAAEQGANTPEFSATVDAVAVESIDYKKTVEVSGEVQAFKFLMLSNELAGIITHLNAESGSVVKKGQVLIELDHRDEDARLIAAKAKLRLNEQTLNRYIKLKRNGEISEDLVDKAHAEVQISQADIALLTLAITKKKLLAPFTAKVGIHTLEVGQYIDNNSSLLELVGLNDFTWVDFYLPQFYAELALGEKVDIQPINTNNAFKADIIAIDPQLSRLSRNLKYRAQLPSSALSLKPNTLIKVIAPIAESKSLVTVPDLSIKRDPFGSYVFVLTPEEDGAYRAKQVKVELGEHIKDKVLILNGLTAGQLIAGKGAFKLFSGIKVYLATQADTLPEENSPAQESAVKDNTDAG